MGNAQVSSYCTYYPPGNESRAVKPSDICSRWDGTERETNTTKKTKQNITNPKNIKGIKK